MADLTPYVRELHRSNHYDLIIPSSDAYSSYGSREYKQTLTALIHSNMSYSQGFAKLGGDPPPPPFENILLGIFQQGT